MKTTGVYLHDKETRIISFHPHWWFFADPAAAVFGSVAVLAAWATIGPEEIHKQAVGILGLVLLTISAIWFFKRYISWLFSFMVITDSRIIFRRGWLNKKGIDVPLHRVNNIIISRHLMERIVGAGDMIIESAGESGRQIFFDIPNPENIQTLIHEQIANMNFDSR